MNKYQNREIQKIVVSLLGSSLLGFKAFFIITGVAVFFAWLPDGLSSLLDKIFGREILEWSSKDGTMITQILGSILALLLVRQAIPKNIANVDIHINDRPRKAKVLVAFISDNKKSKEALATKTISELGINNYRMPLTAIDYHKDKLVKIIIACSDKSCEQKDDFINCVKGLLGERLSNAISVKNIGDFEKAKNVYEFLEKTYEELKKEDFKEDDIVFDVTGGQKAVSIAGAMFAIPNERHLQYVSTSDYTVKHYDLTYANEE